ncbi:Gfo/Idh/MocA family oxidoreductase [Helicobacter sp. 11S02596-1]|uniref:Gfo/Idh/MocA family protein n=1 Tax=Helicobacter sp. 11S02596-1 TaxID=1476194 RepID=UPI000BD31983|nr:Gfo/Idh/MocA family oxidoreductase [Helicobacter sp. 11S02596-1]PAF45163.1 hypothetical protein BJI48_00940 [Helicobacter sp. 11S02596-1]
MSKKVFELAFIGGGLNSAIGYTHFIASQMDHRFKLKSACFSKDPSINAQTAELWGENDLRLHQDWQTLLEMEKNKIDAVCILTPTPSHKQIVSKALQLGHNVICEKTLCMDLQEALEIQEILKQTQGFLAITYNYTGYAMLRELRAMITKGDFGIIHNIQIEMPQEGFLRLEQDKKPHPQKWRMQDGTLPIISLDLGVHCQNIVSFLTHQSPTQVVATSKSNGHFSHIIDDVNILACFQENLIVNMWYSKSALGHRNGLKVSVYGQKMSATWIQNHPEELLINTQNGEKIIKDRASPLDTNTAKLPRYNRFKAGHPAGFIEAFGNYYNDIANALEQFYHEKKWTSDYVFGITSAIKELAFLEAVAKSSQSQKFEAIDPVPMRKRGQK